MTESVIVRIADDNDLPLFEALEEGEARGFTRHNLDLAAGGDYYVLGAFADAALAGYVMLDCRPETDLAPEMKSLWVFPEYRREGIGAALCGKLEEIAAEAGYDEVNLSVDPENPAAIPMYIGLEYTPTGDHRRIEHASGPATEAVYRKSLTLR